METDNSTPKSPKKIRKVIPMGALADMFADIPPMSPKILDDIDAFQNEIDTVNEKASEEIVKIEQKYNILRKPLFEKRNSLINTVPYFWITAFMNHPDLGVTVAPYELECLRHLSKIEVEEYDDIKSGFRIRFYFNENPFIENSFLTKEFNLGSDPTSHHTPVHWKEGCCLLKKRHRKTNTRKRHHKSTTFFSWYEDHSNPTNDNIAELIKDDLWHNPLQYYLATDDDEDSEDDQELGMEEEGMDACEESFGEECKDTVVNRGNEEGPPV